MKKTLLTSAAAVFATAAAAQGQSMDYQVMSDMFGEPVTLGATGAPQRASEVPATMIIITQEQIARAPEYDIPGILRHYSGIDVGRFTMGQGEATIRGGIQGYNPRLLVLVNGREVYLDNFGYTSWSTLPVQLNEIQQIEVVKGAQSALYGFNAVAGVVNIITRNPSHGDYANADASYGTSGFSDLQLTAGRAFNDRFSGRLSYGRTNALEFDPLPGATQAIAQREFADEFTRENYAAAGELKLTNRISITGEITRSESEVFESTGNNTTAYNAYVIDSYRGEILAGTEDFGDFSFSIFNNDIQAGGYTGELMGLRAQNLIKLGANDIVRVAVEYRDASSQPFPDTTGGDLVYTSWSASAMWNHTFSRNLSLTLAGRFDSMDWGREGEPNPAFYVFSQDDYDVTKEEFSYNAALVWRPEFGGSVRLMAGRGIQAPTMFDMGFLFFGGVALVGNPEIEPSIIDNYEIAYDRTFENGVSLRTAAFYVITKDLKGPFGFAPDLLPPAAPVPTILFDNRGDTTTWGFETSLSGEAGENWDWDLNYTFKQADDDLSSVPLFQLNEFEKITPEHVISARLGWESGKLRADGFLNYVSSIDSYQQPFFPSYVPLEIDASVSLSGRVSYDITDTVALSVTAQNANYGDEQITQAMFDNEARYFATLSARF